MKHLLSIKIITLLFLLASRFAYAEGVGPGLSVPSSAGVYALGFDQVKKPVTYYAYKKGTENLSWNFIKLNNANTTASSWSVKVYSPSGLILDQKTMNNTHAVNTIRTGNTSSTEVGIYTIVIEGDYDILYSADLNVKTSATGTNMPGRVYTYEVGLRSSGKMEDFLLYSVNEQGYKYTSTFYGLTPINIAFRINPFGSVLKGSCKSAYKSYTGGDPNAGVDPNPLYEQGLECGGASKIFFNSIAEDVPQTARRWNLATNTQVTEWLNPNIAVEEVTGLTFSPTTGSAGAFTFNAANYVGNGTLKIDVNNNGVYTDAVDRSIATGINTGANSVDFDGNNGSGTAIPCGTAMKAQLILDKPGEIHFVLWDAEGLDGIRITRTNGGTPSPSSIISYDDSNVYTAGKTSVTNPLVRINWNSSTNTTTHSWAYGIRGWGDNAYIDNWAFLPGSKNQEITFSSLCPVPDLTPTLRLTPAQIVDNNKTINMRVVVAEINGVATTGGIFVTIPVSSHYTMNPYSTTLASSAGLPVQNSRWSYNGISGTNHVFTYGGTAAVTSIAANSSSAFGFSVIYSSNAQSGTENVVVSIFDGGGGEKNFANNKDNENINFSSTNP